MLWLLLAVPAMVAWYMVLLRRRKKIALRYASLSVVKEAMGPGQGRRHVPPALLLLALATMLFAVGRPVAVVTLPSEHDTVILAMDVSGSMRATDVQPTRFAAMQAAAKAFVDELPQTTKVGIVSFAATASLVQPPTRTKEDLVAAIDRFQMQRGTAIGSGIIISLATLFPNDGLEVSTNTYGRSPWRSTPLNQEAPEKKEKEFKPVPPGSYNAAVIILLTDGQRTTGPDSIEAAKMAADRGVRIYTVGIGTNSGDTVNYEGWSMRVRLDEETLKQIANMTQGQYFYAGTAADLLKVYSTMNSRILLEKKETEITALLSAVAALLVLLAASLSMLWFNRIL